MAANKLTRAQVRNLPKGKYADGNGLYLVVHDSGSRNWLLRVTVQNMSTSGGKAKRMEIGLGGTSWVDLDEARVKAVEFRKIAKQGKNPLLAEGRDIPSFEQLSYVVFEQMKETWSNGKHQEQWINTLKQYAFSEIGSMRVDHIQQADVLRIIHPIWAGKNETARRIMQRIEKVLDVARASGHREGDNPVALIKSGDILPKIKKGQANHHNAMDWQDLTAFWQKLSSHDATSAHALRFLIFTAARTGEVLGATWDEIDFNKRVWCISAERMKAKRDHIVPLSDAAIEVLEPIKALGRGPYVFEGQKIGKPMSNMTMANLLKRMNRPDVTVHGFRSSFRDWCGDNGVNREVAELSLAHAVGNAVELAYARTDMLERRSVVMQNWANYILGEQSAKILALKR